MAEEEIIYEGKLPFKVAYFSHPGLWFLLWGWNVGFLGAWGRALGQRLKITTQRVVLTSGLFSRDMEEVEFDRVHDTTYHQGLLDRVVDIGTITLFSRDQTAPEFSFLIHNPAYFREEIRQCIKHERRRLRAVRLEE
jgi:hypothetical protein